MLKPIDEVRRDLFVTLQGSGRHPLVARYLKGDWEAPRAPACVLDDRVVLLITEAQLHKAKQQLEAGDDSRPNLTGTLQRWLIDDPDSFVAQVDSEGRGRWLAATTAANLYRWLYSDRDYPSAGTGFKNKMSTAIRGWSEWGFGQAGADQDYLLLINTADLPRAVKWLGKPKGAPPLRPAPPTEFSGATAQIPLLLLSSKQIARIVQKLDEIDLPKPEHIAGWLKAFQERFPLSRLERLEGAELLDEMHGRKSGDSLVYWLEFKNDDTFNNFFFGGIRGGSSLKYVIYQSREDLRWKTGISSNITEISVDQAIAVAEAQRDQLLAAIRVVRALPDDPSARAYATLQADIEDVAPDFHQLAFFHKALFLYAPDKIDDFHGAAWQEHMLIKLGIDPTAQRGQTFAWARHFVSALSTLRSELGQPIPLGYFSSALNGLYGVPVKHWRVVGSSKDWPTLRDREIIAIGWQELGDLSDLVAGYTGREGIEALKGAIQTHNPSVSRPQAARYARQLWDFYHSMSEGDRVYLTDEQRVLGIGEILGPYQYEDDGLAPAYRRRVKWLTTEPFDATIKFGPQAVVQPLTRTFELQTQAALHLDAQDKTDSPSPNLKPRRIAKALAPVVDQLERKGQVILYGPPGTGKTYHALQVAEELVSRGTHSKSWADLSAEQRSNLKGASGTATQRIWTCTFHPAYSYEDFVEGLKARAVAGGIDFLPEPGLFRRICRLADQHRAESFVLIIDEFNRGDSPRIFGELLTLLELDKRERVFVELPLSGERFTIPRNVRILATMNTADRSISLLDAAMRRRFGFVEYMPEPETLGKATVEGLPLGELLRVINTRLLEVLGDAARNLQVGHAYFMSEAQPIVSSVALRNSVRYDLLPLLQEYCAESPDALHSLLGDGFYDRENQRFRDELMETGRESDFIDALVNWDRERLTSYDGVEAEEDDDDEVEGELD